MVAMTAIYQWLWYLLPANPMVMRIVQGASRRHRDLWVRMGYLGALILLVLMSLLFAGGMGQMNLTDLAKAGTQIFVIVSYGQVIFVCLLAPLFMAGAIDQEHAGETYDILLTTPMSNLQIVLGSLLGRLFFVVSLLLSGLPLFAILLIFGGVPVHSVFVAFALAGMVALVVGSVAITLSVSRKGGRKAVYIFVIAIAAYLLGSYAVDVIVRQMQALGGTPNQTTWLTPLHPLLVLKSYVDTVNYHPPSPEDLADRFWLTRFYLGKPLAAFMTLSAVLSLALVTWSALQVRRVGQGASPAMTKLRRWLRLGAEGQRRRPPRTVSQNPIAWREANARGNRLASILGRWGFLAVTLGLAMWMLAAYHFGWKSSLAGGAVMDAQTLQTLLIALLWLELAVIAMVAIYMSAGAVSREREDGTLDLLLTTPVTPQQYVWGKLRGLVSFLTLLLAAPILTVGLVAVYQVVGMWFAWSQVRVNYTMQSWSGSGSIMGDLMLPEAPLLLMLLLVPFAALCVTTGMWWSIKSRGVLGAVIPTVAILSVLSLFLGFCGISAVSAIPLLGTVINALSPVTSLVAIVQPWETVEGFQDSPELGRVALLVSSLVAAGVYGLVVWGLLQAMVRNFDQTVRRLSGTGI